MTKDLTENQLIAINLYLNKRYSPDEIIGVKDSSALHMCVNSVHATAFGEEVYPTVIDKATILFINLIQKHCFHNGNKRTAFVALRTFLAMNGQKIFFADDEAVAFCVEVATWDKDFDELKEMVKNKISKKLNPTAVFFWE